MWGRALRARGAVVVALAIGVASAGAGTASAGTTPPLGTPSGDEAASSCPAGAVMDGISATVDARDYVAGVQARCRSGSATSPGSGAIGAYAPEAAALSACAAGDLGTGLAGRTGDILDAVRIVCTGDDGALVGGAGGDPAGVRSCPAGERLVGLRGTSVLYFGGVVVESLTGVCARVVPTTKQACKRGGWRTWGFRNQGACIKAVGAGRRS